MLLKYLTLPISLIVAVSLLAGCNPGTDTAAVVAPADAGATTPVADIEGDHLARVAQVSLTDGLVSLRPTDTEDWTAADVNQPVLEGTELYAEDGATGEVVLGDNRYVRFADGADVEFTQLDSDDVQLDVTAGTVTLALDELEASEHYEINTPGGAIIPSTGGEFRIDVDENGETWLTVRRGTAQVQTPNGTFELAEGDRVNLNDHDPSSTVEVARYDGTPDDWDNFNDQRRVYYTGLYEHDRPEPVRELYGRTDIYGLAALAVAGVWSALDDNDDRYVWRPRVGADWSPYQNGYWDYSPRVGHTWVSQDSWGWAPYHYGRWDNDGSSWYWSPSDGITNVNSTTWRTNRYTWQPALVYTFRPERSNTIAWVPLGYGEAYYNYSTPWNGGVTTQQINYVPRYYRERRGLVYVTDDGFNRRQQGRRAEREYVRQLEREDVTVARGYVMPKPDRIVAVDRVARVRPSDKVRNRPVVVAADGGPNSKRAIRRAARVGRPIVKAEGRKLDARRADANVARERTAPRVTRQGGKMKADRGANARARSATPGVDATPAPRAVEAAPRPERAPKADRPKANRQRANPPAQKAPRAERAPRKPAAAASSAPKVNRTPAAKPKARANTKRNPS